MIKKSKDRNAVSLTKNPKNLHATTPLAYQLLTHRDEASPSQERIRDRFASKLGCSAIEAPYVARYGQADSNLLKMITRLRILISFIHLDTPMAVFAFFINLHTGNPIFLAVIQFFSPGENGQLL